MKKKSCTSAAQYQKRTTHLDIPAKKLWSPSARCENVPIQQRPERSRVSGLRAEEFGHLIILDRVSAKFANETFGFLFVMDGAISHLTPYPCKSTSPSEVITKFHEWMDTFQMNPKAICADMAFHHPHDMHAFYRMHNVTCAIVQKHSLGSGGCSTPKPGPDHSGTSHSCPIDAQGSNGEKYTSDQKWQDAHGIGHGTKIKRSPEPSFHVSWTVYIHANQAGPPQGRDPEIGCADSSWSTTTRRYSPWSCWPNEVCSSWPSSRRKCFLPVRRFDQNSARTDMRQRVEGWNHFCQRPTAVIQTGATIFQANISKLRRPLDIGFRRTSRLAWASRRTCTVALLWKSNWCLGDVFGQLLFERHLWSASTSGCRSNGPQNKENREFLSTALAGLLAQYQENIPRLLGCPRLSKRHNLFHRYVHGGLNNRRHFCVAGSRGLVFQRKVHDSRMTARSVTHGRDFVDAPIGVARASLINGSISVPSTVLISRTRVRSFLFYLDRRCFQSWIENRRRYPLMRYESIPVRTGRGMFFIHIASRVERSMIHGDEEKSPRDDARTDCGSQSV